MDEQVILLHQLEQIHSYVQFSGKWHLTYFALQLTANGTAMTYYKNHRVPYLRNVFLSGNLLGGVGSAAVIVYYLRATWQINTLLKRLQGSSDSALPYELVSPLPFWLWASIAAALSLVCFAFASGWYFAPKADWTLAEGETQGKNTE